MMYSSSTPLSNPDAVELIEALKKLIPSVACFNCNTFNGVSITVKPGRNDLELFPSTPNTTYKLADSESKPRRYLCPDCLLAYIYQRGGSAWVDKFAVEVLKRKVAD